MLSGFLETGYILYMLAEETLLKTLLSLKKERKPSPPRTSA
jgi:hypothetical protein